MKAFRPLLAAAASAALIACPIAAAAAEEIPAAPTLSTGVPVYQGTAFWTAVSNACASFGVSVGDYYMMTYRQAVEPGNSDYGGGIALNSDRLGVAYVLPANQPLPAGHQVHTVTVTGLSSKVGPYQYSSTMNLTISPNTTTGSTSAVTITGTLTNFFAYTGCNVTFRSALSLRP